MPARNTLVQLLAMYINPESQNAQHHRQTDGRQDYANSRSYCLSERSAKKYLKNKTITKSKRHTSHEIKITE